MKIEEIREAIRAARWTRFDLVGGTRDEFKKQAVGPRLQAHIETLKSLTIPPRFVADITKRDEEIARCAETIKLWNEARDGTEKSRATKSIPTERQAEAATRVHGILKKHYEGDADLRSSLVDLLADARHFAQLAGIDFARAFAMASEHEKAEQAERE